MNHIDFSQFTPPRERDHEDGISPRRSPAIDRITLSPEHAEEANLLLADELIPRLKREGAGRISAIVTLDVTTWESGDEANLGTTIWDTHDGRDLEVTLDWGQVKTDPFTGRRIIVGSIEADPGEDE